MHLLLVGLSHRTAPVELRERLDCQGRLEVCLRALAGRGSTDEAVVLSTCNRAELYAACDDVSSSRADLVKFLGDFHEIDRATLAAHVYDSADLDVVRHLFRVAAGLDSLIVGEPQILGQVKDAHAVAAEIETTGPVLNRLFHSSFAVGNPRAPARRRFLETVCSPSSATHTGKLRASRRSNSSLITPRRRRHSA